MLVKKIKLIVALVVMLLPLAISTLVYWKVSARPILRIPNDSQKVEAVASDTKPVQVKFIVFNDGNAPLLLGDTETSCGCSSATIVTPRVLPKMSTEIIMTIIIPDIGQKDIVAKISTNTLEKSFTLRVTVVGCGIPPYIAHSSPSIRFGQITGNTNEESFVVETRELEVESPWITGVESTDQNLKVIIEKIEDLNLGNNVVRRRYRFKATLLTKPASGSYNSSVLLVTKNEQRLDKPVIPVHAIVH